MKIRGRLTIAFLIIILIPIGLFSATMGAIFSVQRSTIKAVEDSQQDIVQVFTNPIQLLNKITKNIYEEIKKSALLEPSNLENLVHVKDWNKELEKKYSFIVVRKNDMFTYVGNDEVFGKIKGKLPGHGTYDADVDGGTYIGGKEPVLVKQQDFYYDDGSEGSVFIITIVNTILPQIKILGTQIVISFIFVICFTAAILTWWIYSGLVKPLNVLRAATHKVRDGDLDFSIQTNSDDEFSMLCNDFEEMRIRLKASIDMRMAYEQDMREIISNISHDLKTPLTAIEGYTEGIMDGVADTPEKMDKYLCTIHKKASDMNVLVDELAFYSKIDNNTMPYSFLNVNLDQYFMDCIQEVTLDLEVKNIELGYFNYTEKDLKVVADVEQVKRVINNIIGNSVKYLGKSKGIINIRIRDIGELVQIEFEDNGKGIAAEELPCIFDRFYRADASRNSSKGGSGLGLAISKKIIEGHGGSIWAESKEGVGTSIFFTLKKSKQSIPPTIEPEELQEKKGKKEKKKKREAKHKEEALEYKERREQDE